MANHSVLYFILMFICKLMHIKGSFSRAFLETYSSWAPS